MLYFVFLQLKDQYVFIYNALLEIFLSVGTAVPVAEFSDKHKQMCSHRGSDTSSIERQFEVTFIFEKNACLSEKMKDTCASKIIPIQLYTHLLYTTKI